MIGRIRTILALVMVAAVTIALAPVQYSALKLGFPRKSLVPMLWHRIAMKALGFRVRVKGEMSAQRPLLVAANHISWTDIMVIGSVVEVAFIAKSEVAGWPFVGWLARMHAGFAGRTNTLPLRLLVHDQEYYARWLERARGFVRWPELAPREVRGFDWLARRYLRIAEWVVDRPATFLHGEFYPSNIVIERSAEGIRTRPVDWEMAAVGSGILDLAALASGAWGETERRALAGAYREALPAEARLSLNDLVLDLDRARLLLAVQWLGWSAGWTPPPEHAHDWLATALELAEAVGT